MACHLSDQWDNVIILTANSPCSDWDCCRSICDLLFNLVHLPCRILLSTYHLTKVFYLPIHVVQEYLTVGNAEPVHLTKVFYLPIHVVQEYLTVGHAEPVHLTKVFYLPIHVVQEYLTVGNAEPVPPNQGVLLTNSCSTGIQYLAVGRAEPVPPNQGVLLTNSCSTGIPDCRTCRACTT